MPYSIDDLFKKLPYYQDRITTYQADLAKTKLTQYKLRRDILTRIRTAETAYANLYKQLMQLTGGKVGLSDVYQTSVTTTTVKPILTVSVDVSLDKMSFDSTTPVIAHNKVAWVRATIDATSASSLPLPKAYEMASLLWVPIKRYKIADKVPTVRHNVYFSSWPLVIVRAFKAPATGATTGNFHAYVELYERVEPALTE